jgi:SAM-dependent methyltransferase
MNCPVCDRSKRSEVRRLYDDRYGFPGWFPLLACRDCGHRYLKATFDAEQTRQLYADYYPRRDYAAGFRPLRFVGGLRGWLRGEGSSAARWVPPGVKVLDVGCGVGEALAYHQARGCEAQGVEPDPNVRRFAEGLGVRVRIGVFDPAAYPPGHFDYVTLDQVIEHMPRPVATLEGLRTVLRVGGYAVVSTPNPRGWAARAFGARWMNWHAPYHLQHFSRRSMMRAAERAGLLVQHHRTITHPEWARFQLIHCATTRGMGQRSPFWTGSNDYTAAERRVIRLVSLLSRLRISQLVTRTFDAAGLGDSQIFVLRKTAA